MISLTCLYIMLIVFFFFKQKTAYEMRISDWSSDVCSSDLLIAEQARHLVGVEVIAVAVAGAADIGRPIIGCIAYRERFGDACGADPRVGPDRHIARGKGDRGAGHPPVDEDRTRRAGVEAARRRNLAQPQKAGRCQPAVGGGQVCSPEPLRQTGRST